MKGRPNFWPQIENRLWVVLPLEEKPSLDMFLWHISFLLVAAMQQASLVNIGNIQTQTGRMAGEERPEECVVVICCSTNAW